MISPHSRAVTELARTGRMQSDGDVLPALSLKDITVAGISWTDAVLSSTKTDIVLREQLLRSSSFMALIPSGVAALPSPKILAVTFMAAACIASLSLPTSGIRAESIGLSALQTAPVIPLDFATLITPLQKAIVAATVIERSKASRTDEDADAASSSPVPLNTEKITAKAQIAEIIIDINTTSPKYCHAIVNVFLNFVKMYVFVSF